LEGNPPANTPGEANPPGKAKVSGTPKGSTNARAPIDAAALADLVAAEKALTRGDADEALRLVRRSQGVQVTSTSFSLLARAHCLKKDLSNARTAWPRVPAWERTRVRQYCKQHDIAL
jgi:hypothetical protein